MEGCFTFQWEGVCFSDGGVSFLSQGGGAPWRGHQFCCRGGGGGCGLKKIVGWGVPPTGISGIYSISNKDLLPHD